MASINLRRFASLETLRSVGEKHLRSLLSRYESYFRSRSVNLETLDLERLAAAFLAPDDAMPEALVSALYVVAEMSKAASVEELLELVSSEPGLRERIDLSQDQTPVDLALQVFLAAPGVLERAHAGRFVRARKTFECYFPTRSFRPEFETPDARTVAALEEDLAAWFSSRLKGKHVRLFAYSRPDGVWFLVRHGEALRREAAQKGSESTTVCFRPERHDILVYHPQTGELRINARTRGERELYRRKLGHHVFGSEEHFRGAHGKYTLEPLRERAAESLVCSDVAGIDWIRLTEVTTVRDGEEPLIGLRRAPRDLLKALEAEGKTIAGASVRIVSARFRVKFSDSKTPRKVTITPPNVAVFTRDDDGRLVEEWLAKRGFSLLAGKEAGHAEDRSAVA